MNRSVNLSLGAAAGGLLASAFLPVAVAFADVPTGDDPFTVFATQVDSTSTAVTEAGNLDSALYSSDPTLAASLDTDVTTGEVPPVGTGGEAPVTDDAFANLLPADATPAEINEAASYDTVLYDSNPTLAATLAADDSTGAFPDAPGTDAFTLGTYTFDPYTLNADGVQVEGFAPVTEGTGTPTYFDTGTVDGQNFDVYTPATSTTAATALGSIDTNENVTSLFGITNTGFDITSVDPTSPATDSSLPAVGTIYDVTNYGSGYENVYTDVPGVTDAAGTTAAGTVTDELVTPFGDYNLSDLVTAFDLSSLDPGAAFGVGADAAGAAADAVGSIDPLSFLGL